MTQARLEGFIKYLLKEKWTVFGPVFVAGENSAENSIEIKQITNSQNLALDGSLPFYPFKNFFVPEKEVLFNYKNSRFQEIKTAPKIALLGVNAKDLKAVNLYDQVFSQDIYYQSRRKNLLIIGCPAAEFAAEDLKHLPFDIFLAPDAKNNYQVFAGSIKGQRILEHFGYKNYEPIQFKGPKKEAETDERLRKLRDKLKNYPNPKIWEELGQRCIECGKCTLACPTCFCFRTDDEPALEEKTGRRLRCWDSCYYQEFSEVAGSSTSSGQAGHKFLTSAAQRIHFWYFHKFARIPDEFGFAGCVNCGRCAKVCPVGIDIKKVLEEIENSDV